MQTTQTNNNRERAIALGEKLLEIYSPSDNERPAAEFIFNELREHDLNPRFDKSGNVICEVGSGERSILFCPHIDTVPGFLGVRREGAKLYGRGACDAKGAVLSMLLAFEKIAEEMERDAARKASGRVILACAVGEEKQSVGIQTIIADGPRADAAIFGEPCGLNRIAIGYRGHAQASIVVTSREAHSSAPHLTQNSIEVAYSFYAEIKQRLVKKNGGPSNDGVTVAITGISAGVAHNVIPEKTSMNLDVRIPVGRTSKEVISEIQSLGSEFENRLEGVRIHAEFHDPTEPYRAETDASVVRALARSILKSGHGSPAYLMKSGTGDMNTYALALGIVAVTYGPGDPRLSHTDAEYMDIDEVLNCAEILSNCAFEYFELEERKR